MPEIIHADIETHRVAFVQAVRGAGLGALTTKSAELRSADSRGRLSPHMPWSSPHRLGCLHGSRNLFRHRHRDGFVVGPDHYAGGGAVIEGVECDGKRDDDGAG